MIYDIELVKSNNGCFDWNFTGTDISVVTGVQRLRSAVVHSIQCRKGELDLEVYSNSGSLVFEYVRSKNTTQNMEYIRESIISSCREIRGVDDARVELHRNNSGINIDRVVLLYNGVEVDLGGI